MSRRLYFTKFLLLSFAFHALGILAVILVAPKEEAAPPLPTPVRIVRLPPEVLKKLPPVEQPIPRRNVPIPHKFSTAPEIKLPKTVPGMAEPGGGQGEEAGKATPQKEKGPLPFLTKRDIEELARRGMPPKKSGDDSVTLDTDEFKFISYNRWLKMKVESTLRYPELAAVSGIQGVLYIRFDIMKDGSLGTLELLKSSGYKILDDEALRAIQASAPFQPLPPEWNMDRYPIRAAVIFYISEVYIR